MRSPESFDAFYVSTRDRLLHETYALTGDIAASRTAVRDAYVVAWHHWRKVGSLEDREAWIRPQAHRRARRRHTARLWHRDKSLSPEVRDTLDALSKLSGPQRQLLVLTTLSPLSMADIARTVGLTRAEAERQLQTATAQFSLNREVPSTSVRSLLEALREPVTDARWPRATIIRRTGAARRRTHTVVGAGLATAALVLSGSLVATGGGAESTSLAQERASQGITVTPVGAEPTAWGPVEDSALLDDDQVTRLGRRLDWTETSTGDNLDGDGLVAPCQRERFADPEGTSALVRTWEGSTEKVVRDKVRRKGKVTVRRKRVADVRIRTSQLVEQSADPARARTAYGTARAWYAGCQDPRTQLTATRAVRRVGDDAIQFRYRTWGRQPTTVTVGLARTGSLLVTTAVTAVGGSVDDEAALTTLAAAVNALCGTDGAGTCAGRARARASAPVAVGDPAGLLAAVDLPPVSLVRGPWVGTDPVRARANLAATRCDNTSFSGKGVRRTLTRTFLFPESPRADAFGLTQTVGTLASRAKAQDFVSTVRNRIRQCGAANLGTTVTTLADRASRKQELHAWALQFEVSDDRSFAFLMAVVRDGSTVSQVGFTPDDGMTMSRPDFVGVSERALERLHDLPGFRR